VSSEKTVPPAEPADGTAARGKSRAPRSSTRTVPKWESTARDRLRAAVRRFSKPLGDLVARDANEGDTRLLVTDFLCEGLGYDKYEDLTTEYQVKGEFADYGIRIDKQLAAFIEVKRCSQKLNPRHLRQVQSYAVNEGVEWMVLTNGQVWQVYHLSAGLPVTVDLVFDVDLLAEGGIAAKVDSLFYLSKDAFTRRLVDGLWKARAATSGRSLAQVLQNAAVIDAIRKEVRRQTGHNAEPKELRRVLCEEVINPELVS